MRSQCWPAAIRRERSRRCPCVMTNPPARSYAMGADAWSLANHFTKCADAWLRATEYLDPDDAIARLTGNCHGQYQQGNRSGELANRPAMPGKPARRWLEGQGLRSIAADARVAWRRNRPYHARRHGHRLSKCATAVAPVRRCGSQRHSAKITTTAKAARLWLCRQNGSFETVDCRFDVVAFTGNDIQWLKTPLANSVIPRSKGSVLDRIKACFTESIQTQIAAAEALPDAISRRR